MNTSGTLIEFFYGNGGDQPIAGDWTCDGVDSPGMYRASDGFVYLRNSNTEGIADWQFFLGNPSDIALAGDFDGDGCGTVAVYRPTTQEFFVANGLGPNNGGFVADFSFVFGNPGDKPFVANFDGDGIDEVGLHRESTGLIYYRNTLTTGPADRSFIFGDPTTASSVATGTATEPGRPGCIGRRTRPSICDSSTRPVTLTSRSRSRALPRPWCPSPGTSSRP